MKVNRTTLTIYRSFFQLLEKNNFDEITINDICQEAMVSRSTFYSYFPDKYTLVIFALEQEREKLGLVRGENIKQNIQTLLKHMKENQNIYQRLLLHQTNGELRYMLFDHIKKTFDYIMESDEEDISKQEVEKIFYTVGITGVIVWWMEHNYQIEVDELTNYLYSMIFEEE